MPNRVIREIHDGFTPRRLVEDEQGYRFWEAIPVDPLGAPQPGGLPPFHPVNPLAQANAEAAYAYQMQRNAAANAAVDWNAFVRWGYPYRDGEIVPVEGDPRQAFHGGRHPDVIYDNDGIPIGYRERVEKPEIPEEDREVKVVNEFLIGCDPEFIVLDALGAHQLVNELLSAEGEIGHDHGGKVVELRPKPAKTAFTLTKKLWKLLEKSPVAEFKHRAGAYIEFPPNKFSLGGHIHFDLPWKPKDLDSRYRALALDEVTTCFENLDILPKKESAKRRGYGRDARNGFGVQLGYGEFGDVRPDYNRTEYRTMASWLYSPITSLLCLTAAKLATVAPKETIATLGIDPSPAKVQKFFETFSGKDVDAKRVVEKVFEKGVSMQRDPTADFRETWRNELQLIA